MQKPAYPNTQSKRHQKMFVNRRLRDWPSLNHICSASDGKWRQRNTTRYSEERARERNGGSEGPGGGVRGRMKGRRREGGEKKGGRRGEREGRRRAGGSEYSDKKPVGLFSGYN